MPTFKFEEAVNSSNSDHKPKPDKSCILVTTKDKIRTITWNRPERKNAITTDMFVIVTKILQASNHDENVNIVVITGTGDYFCSGNDLANFMNTESEDVTKMAKKGIAILQDFFYAFIDFEKPLIAIVNGPAIGVGVTILAFCDAVFASEKATFQTPFTSLGQSPEACSSYLFPSIMGYARASELLLFSQTITAEKAEICGLVTKVYPQNTLHMLAWERIAQIGELPVKSLIYTKQLVRGREKSLLHEVNLAELARLEERCTSDDCMNAVLQFFARRGKMAKL